MNQNFSMNFFESLHKEEWREVRLGEVAFFQRGYDLPKNQMQQGIYPVAGSNGIIGYHNVSTTKAPGITIGRSGNIGKPKFYAKDFWAHNTTLFVKKFFGNNERFVFYMLQTMDFSNLNSGSAVPTLNRNYIHELKVLFPPLPIQNQIAEILSSFDDKIDLLHRQNQTLESLALTLFRHHFIENPKNPNALCHSEASAEESLIIIDFKRDVSASPQHDKWKMGKLGDWITETIGGDWGKEKPTNDFQEKVFCIRGTDIADLNKGLADKTPIRYIKNQKLLALEPNEGDIIFEISGGTETQSTGRCIFVNQQVKDLFELPIIFSNFCRLLRVKKKEYSYFLYLYLQFLYRNDEFFTLENGTSGIKNLNYKALFYELEYKMPSEIQVIEFHAKIKIYFDKINANKKQIQNLQSMRDLVLAKIFNEKMEE